MCPGIYGQKYVDDLVHVFKNLHDTAYSYILDTSVLPTLCHQFVFGSFLFRHDNAPEHKDSSIKESFSQFGVEEPDWPDLKPL